MTLADLPGPDPLPPKEITEGLLQAGEIASFVYGQSEEPGETTGNSGSSCT